MEIYLSEKYALQIISISKQFGVDAQIIGHVELADKKQVTIKNKEGDFIYD